MAKTANLYTRIDPELKEQAEHILNSLGLPPSSAITMFYKQVVLQQGLPFDGSGDVKLADKVFESLHKEFNL